MHAISTAFCSILAFAAFCSSKLPFYGIDCGLFQVGGRVLAVFICIYRVGLYRFDSFSAFNSCY